MSKELALVEGSTVARRVENTPQSLSINEMMTMAEMFSKSGMFSDVRDVAKAFVKIQAGRELGVPPFAAMRGVSIIQGSAALGATLVAGRMKAHGYDWEEITRNDDKCELRIIKPNGKTAGTSCFSMADAKLAKLEDKENWKKYRRSMLFARCITDAARTWAPEVFSGIPVYTPEELGQDVHQVEREHPMPPVEVIAEVIEVELVNQDPKSLMMASVADKDSVISVLRGLREKMLILAPQRGADEFSRILKSYTGSPLVAGLKINRLTIPLIQKAAGEMWDAVSLAEALGVEQSDADDSVSNDFDEHMVAETV